ncbi:hypothetical protein PF0066 [Pyrococcus furiosus DSM 3638]|nr:hypothetical protein PF0066 [Pyrococcus furiosus DSM 3638]
MESRGFGASRKRTYLIELKMTPIDYLALGIIFLALALYLGLKFF